MTSTKVRAVLGRRPEVLLLVVLLVGLALLPAGLPVGIAATGVVAGAVLSLQAVSMVLLYTRTRILSFAQFGLGAAASVLFYLWVQYNQWAVLAQGACRCLVPSGQSLGYLQHNPDAFRLSLDAHHKWVLIANGLFSAVVAVFLAADTGVRTYRFLARAFARAPRIVPTIATLAFAFALSSGAAALLVTRSATIFGWHAFSWFPYGPKTGTGSDGIPAVNEGHFVAPLANTFGFRLDSGARFHLYDVLSVGMALLALVTAVVLFTRGRRGLLSRAVADNPERASTLGLDVERQSELPWRVAGALSGIAGILAVSLSTLPVVALDLSGLTLVLAAVVIARLTSVGFALLASLLLGVLDQGMFWNFGSHVQFQGSLVVIIAVSLLLQRGRQSRAELSAASVFTTAPEPIRVPAVLRRARGVRGLYRAVGVTVAVVVFGYPFATNPGQLSQGTVLLPYMLIGLSVLVLSGWAGQVSLGQFAFAAVGAYVAVIAGARGHLPLPIALLLGVVAAAAVAPVVGLPALRLPGPFVVIMTLAFSLAVPAVLLNPDLLGAALPSTIRRPVLLGLDLSSDRSFYYLSLAVLGLALGFVAGLRGGRLRRVLIASRENELAAKSMGIDTLRLRITGFSVSGGLAGLGGGLLAYANGSVQAETFSAQNSVLIFLIVIIGGLSAISGPLLGGVAYGTAQLAGAAWLAALNGLGTLIILVLRPGGLASIVFALRDSAIRIILHLQGTDLARTRTTDGVARVAIADRGARAPVVAVHYRYAGVGFHPVEGTRLRSVVGVTDTANESIDSDLVPTDVDALALAEPLLSLERGEVSYGGVRVVSGVTLTLERGEILAIVGTNGAGKTSLLRALAGLEPFSHGSLRFQSQDMTTATAYARATDGMAFVPGGSSVLPTLTVRENLELAARHLPADAAEEKTAEFLQKFPALAARLDTAAGNLSGGEQQVLAVVQGLLREPLVLLIDELSLGLSAEALETILAELELISLQGTAVVLVEQSISTAMSIAHKALFLDRGQVRFQGSAADLRVHPELFAAVAFGAGGVATPGSGSEVSRGRSIAAGGNREPVLELSDVTAGYGQVLAVRGVSFTVGAGEVVGILGPNGAGKTSVFDCLSGTLPLQSGTVSLLGSDITKLATHRRAGLGLMRSYQNVKLFPSLTVRDTIAVALETRLKVKSAVAAGLWLPSARAEEIRAEERVDVLLELLKLEGSADALVGSLSLGSRRLVDLACQLAARPKVLLLDEPTSGMAQSETESLGPLIGRISKDLDCAVLIVEHNIQVLSSVADRLVAMSFGAVIADDVPSVVLNDRAVRAAYFGGASSDATARPSELVPSP